MLTVLINVTVFFLSRHRVGGRLWFNKYYEYEPRMWVTILDGILIGFLVYYFIEYSALVLRGKVVN